MKEMIYKKQFIDFMLENVFSAKEDSSTFNCKNVNGLEVFEDMSIRAMHTGFKAGVESQAKQQYGIVSANSSRCDGCCFEIEGDDKDCKLPFESCDIKKTEIYVKID